jgi:hypothetical protein
MWMDWIRMSEVEWIRRGGEKKKRGKTKYRKVKIKNRKGQFRHFTTSIYSMFVWLMAGADLF